MKNKKLLAGLTAAIMTILLFTSSCSNVDKTDNELSSTDAITSAINGSVTQATAGSEVTTGANAGKDDDTDSEEWTNTGSIALGGTITYKGTGIKVEGSKVTVTAGGDYTVTGTLPNGMICVNTTEKVKLRLSGVNITNSSGPAIFILNAKKAYITLTDGTANYLTDGSKYSVDAKAALFSNDTLEIKGNGTLTVTGNYNHAIASDDNIIMENGTVITKSVTDGLHANNNITFDGGSIAVSNSADGIESEGDVVINGGTISVAAENDGIHADTDLKVTGGKINITKSYEGIEGKTSITIGGGNIRIIASDDALNSNSNITINGGYTYADCNGDGFDSNTDMIINGGTAIIYSGNNANGPLDIGDRTGSFTINGGTVVAAGGNMGITVSDNSKQYSMWINGQIEANTLVNIASQNGSNIATFSPIKSCSLIFISTPKLSANSTYSISTGGSDSGKQTDGIYSTGSYKAGTLLGTVTMSSKSVSYGQSVGGMGRMGGQGGPGGGPGGGKGGWGR